LCRRYASVTAEGIRSREGLLLIESLSECAEELAVGLARFSRYFAVKTPIDDSRCVTSLTPPGSASPLWRGGARGATRRRRG
jgi:hypothetical protein